MLMSFWRLLADLTRSFLRHGCASLAASLAFFSLLSLFPLVFMLLYGVSFIVSHEVIGGQVLLSFLKGFLPTLGERLAVELQPISELETVRWLVFLSFAWFGTLVFYELDYALNVVFDSTWKDIVSRERNQIQPPEMRRIGGEKIDGLRRHIRQHQHESHRAL